MPWKLWVDTGGTFTDCLALPPTGGVLRAKVLSSSRIRVAVVDVPGTSQCRIAPPEGLPDQFFRGAHLNSVDPTTEPGPRIASFDARSSVLDLEPGTRNPARPGSAVEISTGLEAPVLAAHWITRTPLEAELPPVEMRLATTRGTNALLERRGASIGLFITRGFGDLLEIGSQQRPDLFTLEVVKRSPLYRRVVEVDERLDALGRAIRPLDLESTTRAAERLLAEGIEVAAVALLHSYCNPQHERALAAHLRELGFGHVSISSDLAPLIKIVPRAETTVVNAYLSPVIETYLEKVVEHIDPGPLHVLTSAGGLVRSEVFAPKDSLLSGPAGGVVGAATVARRSGFDRCLAFDMGGTSTDVSRYDGELEYRFETRVGDALLLSPSLAIETVAAGGGSICSSGL